MNTDELAYSIGRNNLLNSTMLDHPIFLFFFGQSNTLFHAFTGGDRSTKNASVYMFEAVPNGSLEQTTGWKCAGPDSPDWPHMPTGNSWAYQVCDLIQRITGRAVCGLMVAAGGQPIHTFLPVNSIPDLPCGSQFNAISAAFHLARQHPIPCRTDGKSLADLGITKASAAFCIQGEANADYRGYTDGPEWKRQIKLLDAILRDPSVAGLSLLPFIEKEAPLILGELVRGGTSGTNSTDDRNVEINELDREERFIGAISSDALVDGGDNLHYAGEMAPEIARRMVNKLAQFPKNIPYAVNPAYTIISGKFIQLKGTVTVNSNETITVNLPVKMEGSSYIPQLTLLMSGASITTLAKVEERTATTFKINNPTAANMILAWQVMGLKA